MADEIDKNKYNADGNLKNGRITDYYKGGVSGTIARPKCDGSLYVNTNKNSHLHHSQVAVCDGGGGNRMSHQHRVTTCLFNGLRICDRRRQDIVRKAGAVLVTIRPEST